MNDVYLDHAAGAPLDPRVREAMEPWLAPRAANPSAIHADGTAARDALEAARAAVAAFLGCRTPEVVFTSGGTESANLAVLGVARAHAGEGKHLVLSAVEHHAVLRAAGQLEREGFEVSLVLPGKDGAVAAQDVLKAIRPDTVLVSVMAANSETGMIQPVPEIGNLIQKRRQESGAALPLFHTDACQASPYLSLDVAKLHVDLLTLNAAKAYGPLGAGALFVKEGARLQPLLFGGTQEDGLRAGTENVPGAVGLARALEIAKASREEDAARIRGLRDGLKDAIAARVPDVQFNTEKSGSLPGHLSLLVPEIDGEAAVLYLDARGFRVSVGSACSSEEIAPSHVLVAMGRSEDEARGAIRISLGRGTTAEETAAFADALAQTIEALRSV